MFYDNIHIQKAFHRYVFDSVESVENKKNNVTLKFKFENLNFIKRICKSFVNNVNIENHYLL